MKHLFILAAFLVLPTVSFADCDTQQGEEVVQEKQEISTDVPAYLKGARVCVIALHGTTCVPAEQFKVVPRKQQFLVSKTKQETRVTCKIKDPHKNRVSILAGQGPKPGLHRLNNGHNVEVESKAGAVGGAQYQRLLTEKLSVGAQVQTNESVLLNIGLDF